MFFKQKISVKLLLFLALMLFALTNVLNFASNFTIRLTIVLLMFVPFGILFYLELIYTASKKDIIIQDDKIYFKGIFAIFDSYFYIDEFDSIEIEEEKVFDSKNYSLKFNFNKNHERYKDPIYIESFRYLYFDEFLTKFAIKDKIRTVEKKKNYFKILLVVALLFLLPYFELNDEGKEISTFSYLTMLCSILIVFAFIPITYLLSKISKYLYLKNII